MQTKCTIDIVKDGIENGNTMKEIYESIENAGCFIQMREDYAGFDIINTRVCKFYDTPSSAIAAEFEKFCQDENYFDFDTVFDGKEPVSIQLDKKGYYFSFGYSAYGFYATLEQSLDVDGFLWDIDPFGDNEDEDEDFVDED